MSGSVHCDYYASGRCRSCAWIELDYAEQLTRKQAQVEALLGPRWQGLWQAAEASALRGFRNKAKLAVGGSVEAPTLGLLDAEGEGVDLADCLLYPESIRQTLPALKAFIGQARLAPYRLHERRGELKYLLLTTTPAGDLMLRFVLRSREALPRIVKHLSGLREAVPALRVISANLQPTHAAILEGPEELHLAGDSALCMAVNEHRLFLQPSGFFQTHTEMAAALYRCARAWCADLPVHHVLDLYCGIGGFALHLARDDRRVSGIELSAAAIASAQQAAADLTQALDFRIGDAGRLHDDDLGDVDLLVVNPPRRGLGERLCRQVGESPASWLLYSSCNPESLARDLAALADFEPRRAKLFDMFPHTAHCEVLTLLQRRGAA